MPSEGKPITKVCTSHLKLVKRENIIRLQDKQYLLAGNNNVPRAKKVVSDSPGLVDFAIGLVNSVFSLPDGQVKLFEEFE